MFGHDHRELAAVFVGGAVGTLARAALGTLAVADPGRWPWPTFTVNIVGAFLLGAFASGLLDRPGLHGHHRLGLSTGLCGGLTTFSTMQVETLIMIGDHRYRLAAEYTAASIAAGLLAVYLATVLARRIGAEQ